jgi:hypothetical protein
MRIFAFILALIAAMPAAPAQQRSAVTLHVKNDVPKFERFYRDASKPGVTEAKRWALWQQEYGIAAVPPTPEGQKLARKQLDAAWPRYKALLPQLPALTSRAIASANVAVRRISQQLDPQATPATIVLLVYVGQFDNNAFSVPAMNGAPPETLMPVETPNIELLLAHELSHDVNFALAGVKNSFGAPLGETIFLEGLAMRSASRVFPGQPDSAYTEMPGDHGWLANCLRQKTAVLRGVSTYLHRSGPEIGARFTFGDGTTGMHREAYCAGWIIFGTLLEHGQTLAHLATIPEDRMIETVRRGIEASM